MNRIKLTKDKYALVDDQWFEYLNKFKWHVTASGVNSKYAAANYSEITPFGRIRTTILMHHIIMGKPLNELMVDHKNGDGLDNREDNLRIVTRRQNSHNKKRHREGKLVGAIYFKQTKRWRAGITVNKQHYHLGYFQSEKLAHEEYIKAHIKLIGDIKI